MAPGEEGESDRKEGRGDGDGGRKIGRGASVVGLRESRGGREGLASRWLAAAAVEVVVVRATLRGWLGCPQSGAAVRLSRNNNHGQNKVELSNVRQNNKQQS
jgi:hypothetical protein